MKELRILLVGGGSGGHVYPLVAVAESLRQKASASGISLKVMMLGGAFIRRAAKEANLPYKVISTGKLRRYGSIENVFDFVKFFIGFFQSLWILYWFMPDKVFAKGGAASVAPALVAKLFFIPLYIHESDSVPGLANSILGGMADGVFLSFKTAEKFFDINKVVFTGNPVRKSLFGGNREEAVKYFNFSESRRTILVLGGSQGAKIINDIILSSLVPMTERFNIIHQCGEGQFNAVKAGLDVILNEGTAKYADPVKKYYRYYGFLDEHQLSLAYALADVVISRAGAGALFEIAQLGKPAIVVPISQSSRNHQYLNAFEFSLSGAFLIEENGLIRESLMRQINNIFTAESYDTISGKIRSFATPDAADKIAEALLSEH